MLFKTMLIQGVDIPRAMTLEERKRIDQLPPAARPAAIKSILRESEQTGSTTAITDSSPAERQQEDGVPEWKVRQDRLRAKSREKLERKQQRHIEREERLEEREQMLEEREEKRFERETGRDAGVNDVTASSSRSISGSARGGDVPRAMTLEERRGVDNIGNTLGKDVKGHEVQGIRSSSLRGSIADAATPNNDATFGNEELPGSQLSQGRNSGPYKKMQAGDDCPSVLPDISVAMQNADQEMVKCIVKAQMGGGITVSSKGGSSSCPDDFTDDALFNAASKAELDVARCLIEKGASIDLTFKKGRTALMEACRGGIFGLQLTRCRLI